MLRIKTIDREIYVVNMRKIKSQKMKIYVTNLESQEIK